MTGTLVRVNGRGHIRDKHFEDESTTKEVQWKDLDLLDSQGPWKWGEEDLVIDVI